LILCAVAESTFHYASFCPFALVTRVVAGTRAATVWDMALTLGLFCGVLGINGFAEKKPPARRYVKKSHRPLKSPQTPRYGGEIGLLRYSWGGKRLRANGPWGKRRATGRRISAAVALPSMAVIIALAEYVKSTLKS
jgi:hypothetical protein